MQTGDKKYILAAGRWPDSENQQILFVPDKVDPHLNWDNNDMFALLTFPCVVYDATLF